MGRDRGEHTSPDLFSNDRVGDSLPLPTKSPAATAAIETAAQRHVLPRDLPSAVKHLSDGELDLMYGATLEEMKRRGRLSPGVESDLLTLRHRFEVCPDPAPKRSPPSDNRRHAHVADVSLTRGQVNAVRDTFKACARQFGISRPNVRKALSNRGTI